MKNLSKETYLEKLMFFMSFHFSDEESRSILGDYEEWFFNETLQGKTEEEICLSLGSPQKVVSNLLTESGKHPVRMRLLLQNTIIQCLLLMCTHCFLSILFLKSFDRTSTSYLYSGSVMLLVYFAVGSFVSRKSRSCLEHGYKHIFYKIHLILFGLTAAIILAQAFIFTQIHFIYAGIVCCYLLHIMITIIFLTNICIVRNLFQDKQMCISITLHMLGILTILFYTINQLHMLQCSNAVYGSLTIYIETVLLCLVIFKKAKTK